MILKTYNFYLEIVDDIGPYQNFVNSGETRRDYI